MSLSNGWFMWAALSAVFAALTAIFAKIGLEGVDSDLATLVRQIDTDMELLFPQDYIPGTSERMLLYRELDNIEAGQQLDQFRNGLEDRFGPLPKETTELLEVVKTPVESHRTGNGKNHSERR